jgi:arginyl-tRNA--protein-N-Asp/Glu arginylyltransferase
MAYLHWNEKTINDSSEKNISDMYNRGYVFTRLGKGVMQQTRSVRIDLKKFKTSSENRRILRKGESVTIEKNSIPYKDYGWEIAKMAKVFYEKKADGSFSANKIKELITSNQNSNAFLTFKENNTPRGYAICYENSSILHYSYPFYDLEKAPKDMGLIMMTKAIADAKSRGLSYVYLGSLQRPADTYKLQFAGLEWYDGKEWTNDIKIIKEILSSAIK